MSRSKEFVYDSYAKIAAAFIEGLPTCRVSYGFNLTYDKSVLMLEGTGLYLRDIRCWLPDNFDLRYGNTQDTIIIIDKNHE